MDYYKYSGFDRFEHNIFPIKESPRLIQEKDRFERLTESSEVYFDDRESSKRKSQEVTFIIGSAIVENIKKQSDESGEWSYDHAELKDLVKDLKRKIKKIKSLDESALLDMLKGMKDSSDKEVQTILASLGKKKVYNDKDYIDLARGHHIAFLERRERFGIEIEKIKQKFLERIEKQIDSGRYKIDIELIRQRIEQTDFDIIDANVITLYEGESDMAFFNVETSRIYLSSVIFDETLEHDATHELLHLAAGRTILHKVDSKQDKQVMHQRSGLQFDVDIDSSYISDPKIFEDELLESDDHDYSASPNRFWWLDEAVTEREAMNLVSDKDGTYDEERGLLEVLLEKIPEQEFLDSYFENLDPKKGKDRIKHWKQLRKSFNEAFSPRFLIHLDNFIYLLDSEEAIFKDDSITEESACGIAAELIKKDRWQEIEEFVKAHKKTQKETLDIAAK